LETFVIVVKEPAEGAPGRNERRTPAALAAVRLVNLPEGGHQ
jgi:hypothetical protein